MSCAAIQEFTLCLPADSGLLRTSVNAGEPIDQAEVLSLGAMAQSLFITVTIESRGLDRVDDCFSLWAEAAQVFSELCDSWAGIRSDDPQIEWLRGRLQHFAELCQDRRSLYQVSESDRKEFSSCKESDMRSEAPATLQPFSEREIKSIDAALNRRLTAAGNR